jgi:type II secretory pathway pseudopilin PulG
MQKKNTTRRVPKPSEEGYLLLSIMFLLFLLTMALAVAVPRMSRSIQRDKDLETMERGKQYRRAVQLYYRKFHAYPPSVDALVKTNEIRFLRKKYIDPVTGKDDWKPIMFGQNKVPIAMGFFGQPLAAGSSLAGIGPSGGNAMNGLGSGINGGLNSGFNGGSSNALFNSPGSTSNSSSSGTNDTSGTNGQTGTTGSSSATGTGGTDSSGSTSSNGGLSGQTFGGAGIIGFEPASSKQSILIWKKKDHYNEWEFTYDPIMEMKTMGGGNTGMIGQPASGMSSPVGSSPFSSTPTTGSSSTPTTTPSTSSPQQ